MAKKEELTNEAGAEELAHYAECENGRMKFNFSHKVTIGKAARV